MRRNDKEVGKKKDREENKNKTQGRIRDVRKRTDSNQGCGGRRRKKRIMTKTARWKGGEGKRREGKQKKRK